MQSSAVFLRDKMADQPSARELDRMSRAVWENIASETGSRRGLPGKIARTYLVARDIQNAILDGSKTVWSVIGFFKWVAERSFIMRMERA